MPEPDPPLLEADAPADPLELFERWFRGAADTVPEPEAMALATCGPDARPSVRMVLLKGWDRHGFLFHTNYGSRKAAELEANPRAAIALYWAALGRQVRAEGAVARVPEAESDAYFATRPRGGQIGAHASHQSRPVADRDELDRRVAVAAERFAGMPVPRPPWWGGYRLAPDVVEFWRHRDDRLHDRLQYRADGRGGWAIGRLQP